MKARVTLTKLSKKMINHSEDNFSSYEQFLGEVFMRQLWFRSQYFRLNLSGWKKFAGLKEVWISCHSVELQLRRWRFESNRSSNERFWGEVVTVRIWFRSHDSDPTCQAERNLLAWINCESVIKASKCNPDIEGLNPTEIIMSDFMVKQLQGIFDSGRTIQTQLVRLNEICWSKSNVNE